MGKIKEAEATRQKNIELLKRKLEVDTYDAVVLSRLAASYSQKGDKFSALDALNKVMKITSNDGLVLYNSLVLTLCLI